MGLSEAWTTIRIKNWVHQNLLKLKIHPRESFNNVIIRLTENELTIKSENVWSNASNILKDVNVAREKLQSLGFVSKEPTMIVPEYIYSYLETKVFYPIDEKEFSHAQVLLKNSIVDSIISVKSTENVVYLGIARAIKDGYFYGIKKPLYAKPRKPYDYNIKLTGGSRREGHHGDVEYFVNLTFTSEDRFTIEDIALTLKHTYLVSLFWEGWRFFWEMNDSSKDKTPNLKVDIKMEES